MAAAKGSSSIDIAASPDRIMSVVTDINAYPEWVKEMKQVSVSQADSSGRPLRASFAVDAKVKTVRYELDYSYEPNVISWHSVDGGDVSEISGSYRMNPNGSSTRVEYDYAIDPGFPMPAPVRKQAVKLIVATALKGLKKRVESIPA
ncbi:MAG: SRPBCC family protein [Actinomycetota bacterium]